MKKLFTLTILCCLLFRPGFAQLARNAGSQLPSNFQSTEQQAYNRFHNPDITFQQFLINEEARFYHEDALRLDSSLRYRPFPPRPSMCGNGDFEIGLDPNEWQGGYGFVDASGTILYGGFANGIVDGLITDNTAHQTVVSVGADPNAPIHTTAPTGSTHAIRLGNAANGNGAELLSKTFVVPSNNSIVSFWYALVLEDPLHNRNEQPAFRVNVLDASGSPIPGLVDLGNGSDVATSDANNPFFISYTGSAGLIAYRDWSCASINLTRFIGQQVTVQFVTNDCTQGGHYGYAYIDDFCGSCSSNAYNLSLANTVCGSRSQVCINYQLPMQGSQVGAVNIDLNIYQNGNLLTTLNSGTLNSGSGYCFAFAPSSIPGFDPALGGFDYTAVGHFTIGSVTLSPFYLFAPPDGSVPGLNNDCSFVQQCCPGRNLIENGDFESGNGGFASDFIYQPVISANSVWISEYSILNDAEAQTVASTWNPDCPSSGHHLIVNGATGQSTGYRKAWEQVIIVAPETTYKFCGDIKLLPACAFNVKAPRINLTINDGIQSITTRITLSPTSGSCNWQKIERVITVPAGSNALTITISLSEALVGDGNDVAMDNFSLVKMDAVPASQLDFGLTPYNFNGWNYNVTANPSFVLPGGCTNYWEVAEVDPNAGYAVIGGTSVINPTAWTPLTTNTFIGYNGTNSLSGNAPGVFDMRKTYRFVYGRSCTCSSLSKRFIIYGPIASRASEQSTRSDLQVLASGMLEGEADQSMMGAKAEERNMFKIFPNPTSSKITVEKFTTDADYEIKVFNILGQLVKTIPIKIADTKVEFSVAALTPGNYVVHVVSTKGVIIHSEKITKQ